MTRECLPRLALALAGLASTLSAAADTDLGRADFVSSRDPPAYQQLGAAQQQQYELGHALFNTQWVAAATPHAERRDGLGPLFNADACDACHNEGARGRGLSGNGAVPAQLVIQLDSKRRDDCGDPVYGHVLNSSALAGFTPEASVQVRYTEVTGKYRDGSRWSLRRPHYLLNQLSAGPLAASTIVSPRLAPALFGAGLLERVPAAAIVALSRRQRSSVRGKPAWQTIGDARVLGRFGWQDSVVSIEAQTLRALSREMGLSSTALPHDDCTAVESACRDAANGGEAEVSDEFVAALLVFQRWLAVPRSPLPRTEAGAELFAALGCSGCHQPSLPLASIDVGAASIAPYTDLLLHDLGPQLADRDAAGQIVPSRWRTAPLWGLGHALARGGDIALLHDGRARTPAEAILWHGGEAAAARQRYLALDAARREALNVFLGSL